MIHLAYATRDEKTADAIRSHLSSYSYLMDKDISIHLSIVTDRFIQEKSHLSLPRKQPVIFVYPREFKLPQSWKKRFPQAQSIYMDRFDSDREFYDALNKLLFPGKNVEELVVPEGTQKIDAYAYEDCHGIVKVKLPQSLQSIGYRSFARCENIQNIIIPKNVRKIEDEAFYACKSLTSIEFPEKLESIGKSAFNGCYSLQSISLPGIRIIEPYAFSDCTKLQKVSLGKTICMIGDGAFEDCKSLESFVISQNE